MANPQKRYYTEFDNELLDGLIAAKLNATQLSIVLCLVRKSFGFQNEQVKISIGSIAKATGYHRATVYKALNFLINKNIVILISEAEGISPQVLAVNLNCSEWHISVGQTDNSFQSTYRSNSRQSVGQMADTTISKSAYTAVCRPETHINKERKKEIYKEKERKREKAKEAWAGYPMLGEGDDLED